MKKFSKILLLALCAVMCFSMVGCGGKSSVDDIKKRGKLIVATSANFPPFEFMEGTEVVGWDIDVARYFASELGVSLDIMDLTFEMAVAAPTTGVADIAMAGLSINEERKKNMDFTVNIFDSSQMIIVKSDSTITGAMDLAGKKVGAQNGTIGLKLAELDPELAFDADGNQILGTPSDKMGFTDGALAVKALLNGTIDAVIIDKYPAQAFVKANAGTKLIEQSIYDDAYAFAVKKGNQELVDFLNATIKKMNDNGEMKKITDKWFGAEEN